jgi:hypothetical protein
VRMSRGEMEDHWPLACLTPPVDPHHIMKHPPRRRMVTPLPLWVGTRGLMIVARVPTVPGLCRRATPLVVAVG